MRAMETSRRETSDAYFKGLPDEPFITPDGSRDLAWHQEVDALTAILGDDVVRVPEDSDELIQRSQGEVVHHVFTSFQRVIFFSLKPYSFLALTYDFFSDASMTSSSPAYRRFSC